MNNPKAYAEGLALTKKAFERNLKECGYKKFSLKKPECLVLLEQLIEMIFEAQDRRPLHDLGTRQQSSWNGPSWFSVRYIMYHVAHMNSRHNHKRKACSVENLALADHRGNAMQSSLDYEEFGTLLGGPTLIRVRQVLRNRKKLFASKKWKLWLEEMEQYAKR